MNDPLLDFITACIVMGLGIGTDVALATALRAQQLATYKIAFYWIFGVTLTHTLFPMLGYLATFFGIQIFPMLTPVIGIIASACISHFLWSEFQDMANEAEEHDNKDKQFLVSFALILAVSWDALWSGPAKSAQVVGWTDMMIWGSFLLVGIMVSVAAISSWLFGRWLVLIRNQQLSPKLQFTALWLQYSIIGYFGLLALTRYTFVLTVQWWLILLVSSLIILVLLNKIPNGSPQLQT